MKAAIYHGPRDIRLEEVDDPKPGDMGMVIRVRAAGICGSDLAPYTQAWIRYTTGNALGHEYSGDVVEVGSKVTDVEAGDRVWATAMLPCFKCEACQREDYFGCRDVKSGGVWGLHGGFAEYVWVPVVALNRNVFKLTDNMSYQDGALVEPVGVGTGTVRRAEPNSSDTAIVLGVGPVGLGVVARLKDLNLPKVVASDVAAKRLATAKELGADVVINPTEEDVVHRVMEETPGVGADIVVEAAGTPETFLGAIDMVRRDGKVMVVAVYKHSFEFDPSRTRPGMIRNNLVRNNVRMIGCAAMDAQSSFDLISGGKVRDSQVVSHVFPLDKIVEAFETQLDSKETIKVMIEP